MERALSMQITVKCQKLEEEQWRMKQEVELQQIAKSNAEVKIKQVSRSGLTEPIY